MKLTSTQASNLTTISALLHGDSGIGKTTSALTLPSDRTLLAIGERGTLPLRNSDYPVLQFNNWSEMQDVYRLFAFPDKIEDASLKSVIQRTRILFIDSLSECSEMCMRHIVTVDRKKLTNERTKGQRDAPLGIYEDQMTIDDWGLYGNRIQNMMSVFTRLPIHVIFTSLSKWSTDKQGGETLRTPNLSGRMAQLCPAQFDLVLHMESDSEGKRTWRTFNDGNVIAKDASGVLDQFEEANWTKLFTKILKGSSNAKAD